jgi:hypothetical protein
VCVTIVVLTTNHSTVIDTCSIGGDELSSFFFSGLINEQWSTPVDGRQYILLSINADSKRIVHFLLFQIKLMMSNTNRILLLSIIRYSFQLLFIIFHLLYLHEIYLQISKRLLNTISYKTKS